MRISQLCEYDKQPRQDDGIFPTVINSFSKIAGDISLTTDVRVDGTVYGLVESEKNIFIGTDGYVKGVLRAKNLVSFGRIEGSVIISGISIFHPGSSLFGKLYTKDINVLQGATLSAHVVTYDLLDPIDEAQICLDEEKTRSYAKKLKAAQESVNSFPMDYQFNQVIKNTIDIIEDTKHESATIVSDQSFSTATETTYAEVIEIPEESEDFASHLKETIKPEEFIRKLEEEKKVTFVTVNPEDQTSSREKILKENKSGNLSTPASRPKQEEKEKKSESFVFESLSRNPAIQGNDFLISEIEKLNQTSKEIMQKKSPQRNDKNMLSTISASLFHTKQKSSQEF